MPTRPAKTAEDVADTVTETVKSLIDRLVDAELTKQLARRGQDVAGVIAERGADVGERATEAWRESRPLRRDAAKRVSGATEDAAKWSDSMWRGAVAPALRDLWKRRTIAAGAAGAAVPASRELLESAAVRLGLKERQREEERRRWGAFFLGMVLGAVAGTVVALLTTPKRGSDVRRELGVRAEEMRRELGVRADEIAARAREADWMPVFQREGESGNGHTTTPAQPPPSEATSSPVTSPKPAASTSTSSTRSSTSTSSTSASGAEPRRAATGTTPARPATSGTPATKPTNVARKKKVEPEPLP
ncbi:MAG: YtxH domain-containing protein [Chloroflexi bacterium]|nr:YtxH domain-containing protein [Chloroflexota bacterium]